MKRRDFIKNVSAGAAVVAIPAVVIASSKPNEKGGLQILNEAQAKIDEQIWGTSVPMQLKREQEKLDRITHENVRRLLSCAEPLDVSAGFRNYLASLDVSP